MTMKRFTLLFILVLSVMQVWAQSKLQLKDGRAAFCSGMNVAWNDFGNDVADAAVNKAYFNTLLDNVKAAGGNTVRWWLFTNASRAPKFNNNLVSGLGTNSINNVKIVLDLAKEKNMTIVLCLFSFDLLQTSQYGVNAYNNKQMLTTDAGVKACVEKCIVPLVTAIGNHPAINCWEIFNEPEGMLQNGGWTNERISMYDIQRFVNRAAGAIHRAVPEVLVSNGSKSMFYLSPKIGKNYYSDYELKNAGGDNDGYLDYYQVHYYDNEGAPGTQHSPFHHDASYWQLDKPILVAEFGAKGYNNNFNMSSQECYKQVYNRGYVGALSWTYSNTNGGGDGFGGYYEAKDGMNYLSTNFATNLLFGPIVPPYNFGTNIALGKTATSSSNEIASTNTVSKINDGDKTTRWSSDYFENQWVVIDLKKVYDIENVVLKWESAYGKDFSIEVSNNLQIWTSIYSNTNGKGGTEIIEKLTGSGQYLRLKLNSRASQWGFSLFEIEVYGTPSTITSLADFNTDAYQVFPNPFQDRLNISLPNDAQVQIRALSGQLMYEWNSDYIETSEMASGIYFLSILEGSKITTYKVSKN
jgi:hypothetical protein